MIDEKFSCASCEYFRANSALEQPGVIAANDTNGSRIKAEDSGHCYLNPPRFHMIAVPSKMDPRVGQLQQLPVFPIVLGNGTCSWHSARVEMLLKGAIKFQERNRREYLDYRPGQNDDRIAAGFSRMPSIAEAVKHSRGASEKPGDPLPADTLAPVALLKENVWQGARDPVKPAPRVDTWLGRILKFLLNKTRGL